jgi:haloacetate dehalogenase
LALWRDLADAVDGRPVDAGHFFPEEHPADAATALRAFFSSGPQTESARDAASTG